MTPDATVFDALKEICERLERLEKSLADIRLRQRGIVCVPYPAHDKWIGPNPSRSRTLF